MKYIIDHKVYDTEKSTEIIKYTQGRVSNEIDVYTFKNQLIGQREGLQHALDLLKIQEKSLQNSIDFIDKELEQNKIIE